MIIVYSDECACHVCGKVNRHCAKFWSFGSLRIRTCWRNMFEGVLKACIHCADQKKILWPVLSVRNTYGNCMPRHAAELPPPQIHEFCPEGYYVSIQDRIFLLLTKCAWLHESRTFAVDEFVKVVRLLGHLVFRISRLQICVCGWSVNDGVYKPPRVTHNLKKQSDRLFLMPRPTNWSECRWKTTIVEGNHIKLQYVLKWSWSFLAKYTAFTVLLGSLFCDAFSISRL
jgi:hypothetical protein